MIDAPVPEERPADDPAPGSMPGPTIDAGDDLSAPRTTRVMSRTLRSPILEPTPRPMPVNDGPTFELIIDRRSLALHSAGVIAVAVPFVVIGQAGLGMAAAASTAAILVMRRVGRGVQFGFGDGFIGYHGGLGWPRGVQEEYDVSWAWPTGAPMTPNHASGAANRSWTVEISQAVIGRRARPGSQTSARGSRPSRSTSCAPSNRPLSIALAGVGCSARVAPRAIPRATKGAEDDAVTVDPKSHRGRPVAVRRAAPFRERRGTDADIARPGP